MNQFKLPTSLNIDYSIIENYFSKANHQKLELEQINSRITKDYCCKYDVEIDASMPKMQHSKESACIRIVGT